MYLCSLDNVISIFIGGPLENQLVEGQPSLKEFKWNEINRYSNDNRVDDSFG